MNWEDNEKGGLTWEKRISRTKKLGELTFNLPPDLILWSQLEDEEKLNGYSCEDLCAAPLRVQSLQRHEIYVRLLKLTLQQYTGIIIPDQH